MLRIEQPRVRIELGNDVVRTASAAFSYNSTHLARFSTTKQDRTTPAAEIVHVGRSGVDGRIDPDPAQDADGFLIWLLDYAQTLGFSFGI
jgi:hypothetical protein